MKRIHWRGVVVVPIFVIGLVPFFIGLGLLLVAHWFRRKPDVNQACIGVAVFLDNMADALDPTE